MHGKLALSNQPVRSPPAGGAARQDRRAL